MFERLKRYRADRERYVSKIEEFQKKVDELDEKIRKEEALTIAYVMEQLELTPEKAAEKLGFHEEEKKPVPKKPVPSEKSTDKKDAFIKEVSGADSKENFNVEDVLNEVF